MRSSWDKDLPNITLENVDIRVSSLSEAWKSVSSKFLVRSVLVTSERALEKRPFEYESATCTARNIYDALATSYGLSWKQDELTGVVWFYPVGLPYEHILGTKVQTSYEQLGLPMQSGILEPLGKNSSTGINVKPWGSAFLNTFNYAVDIPAGVRTVRDILNLCCLANPAKTFSARMEQGDMFVTAVNLGSDEVHILPAGALHLWNVEVRQSRENGAPTKEQLITALADSDPEIRRAARNYLEALIWRIDVDELVALDTSTEEALWTCIGVTSILVRSEDATHRASIETMELLATDEFLAICEPGLAVLVALDLARLTKNERALEVVTERELRTSDLAPVVSDACRIAALSAYIRRVLKAKRAEGLVRALGPLARMVQSPAAGKLEFKPVVV
jgi:hypothetical protein